MPELVSVVSENKVSSAALLNGEKLLSPAAAAKASNIPGYRGGPHVNGCTIFRQITKGTRTANGELIRIEAVRVGRRWLTSLEALARFYAKLTDAALPSDETPPQAPTPKARNRAAAAAHDELAAVLGARHE